MAVDADPLSPRSVLAGNYVNVIVFSQKGARPLPNMLSGSDLVGFLYMTCLQTNYLVHISYFSWAHIVFNSQYQRMEICTKPCGTTNYFGHLKKMWSLWNTRALRQKLRKVALLS